MVYATRSRGPAPTIVKSTRRTAATSKRASSQKKSLASSSLSPTSPSASDAKSTSTEKSSPLLMKISTSDTHSRHPKDGKDHHVIEQDGQDHHHIWYKNFESRNEDQPNAQQIQSNSGSRREQDSQEQKQRGQRRPMQEEEDEEVEASGDDAYHLRDGRIVRRLTPEPRSSTSNSNLETEDLAPHHLRFADYSPPPLQMRSHTRKGLRDTAGINEADSPMVFSTEAPHLKIQVDRSKRPHPHDGKDHHELGGDGLDHHHIRFGETGMSKNYGTDSPTVFSTEDPHLEIHVDRSKRPHPHDGKDHHETGNDGLDHHHVRFGETGMSENYDTDSSMVFSTEKPHLKIHVDRSKRPHPHDGKDHHELGDDGLDHHHIRFGENGAKINASNVRIRYGQSDTEEEQEGEENEDEEDDDADDEDTMDLDEAEDHTKSTSLIARAGRAKSYLSSLLFSKSGPSLSHLKGTTDDVDMNSADDADVHIESSESRTPLNLLRRGSKSFTKTTTTKVYTTRQQRHRNESATHQLTEKSQLDRHRAREAIQLLDNDVVLLQNLLLEKEQALRDAESRVTTHTETLTREIYDLERTIKDLRLGLTTKEKKLNNSQYQHREDQQRLKELSAELKKKEIIQAEAQNVQDELDEANSQRARLMVQIQNLKDTLRQRENDLRGSQVTITDLQDRDRASKEEMERISNELTILKGSMVNCERDLKKCQRTIKTMEIAQSKVQGLEEQLQAMRGQLSESESALKDLEETNSHLVKENDRVGKLTEKVRILKADIKDREFHLSEAEESMKDLRGYKDRATELEDELKDLRDQVSVQEKHLDYLEEAMESHQNCGFETQRLQEEVESLSEKLREKEEEIKDLQRESYEAEEEKEHLIKNLQEEMHTLLHQMEAKEDEAQALKDKSEAEFKKVSSTASELRTEVERLRQSLDEKSRLLKDASKKAEELDSVNITLSALKIEVEDLRKLARGKERTLKEFKKKVDTANLAEDTLRTEIENLRNLLETKTQSLKDAKKTVEDFSLEKERNMTLTIEITRLEKMISDKDRYITGLDKMMESMRDRADRADDLETEVKGLRKGLAHAEKRAEKSEKDLAAASSTASKLVVDLESLREQLSEKESELAEANKMAEGLEMKSNKIKALLSKIADLEEASEGHIDRSLKAERKVKTLELDMKAMETRLGELQRQLKDKEAGLQAALDKANKEYELTVKRLNESRSALVDMRKQLSEAEKETKAQIKAKEDQIKAKEAQIKDLRRELQNWEKHEEGWVDKTTTLTTELVHGVDVLRHKEKIIHDLQQKLSEHNLEVTRLNEAVNDARSELRLDRKRRAFEIEDQVYEKTLNLQADKAALQKTVSGLENQIEHLEKRIRLDHDHEAKELELAAQIRELQYWKQNSTEQTKEWETTVTRLQSEKESQVAMLKRYERQISKLQSTVEENDAWRLKAIEQAENLTAMIANLEKELRILKSALAEHDANDAKLSERIRSLEIQTETLEGLKDDLHREIRTKDGQIAELEERLKGEISSYKARLSDTRRELVAKDRRIEILQSRIAEYTRHNADLESKVAKDKDSLEALESTLDKLHQNLSTQLQKYKSLEGKHLTSLTLQAQQDEQLSHLEKQLARVSSEDSEKQKQLLSRNERLINELDEALQKTEKLQVEIHHVTKMYHNTLAELKDAQTKMDTMVPKDKANHDACAARVQAGEQEVAKLSDKISELKATMAQMSKDHSLREKEWARAESGYKDRIQLMSKSQHVLEGQLRNVEKSRDQERVGREHDRLRHERERLTMDETIQGLKNRGAQMQKEYEMLETKVRTEMSTSKDLTALLTKLKQSIRKDSEEELRSLDELEKQLLTRESVVEETIQTTRNRMDSGAFIEMAESAVAH